MMSSLERSLSQLRVELSPSSADKARLRARIVAPGLAAGASPIPAPRLTRLGALKAAGSVGLAAGGLLLGVGLGAGYWLGRDASAPAVALVSRPASAPVASVPAADPEPSRVAERAEPRLAEPVAADATAPEAAAKNASPSEPRRRTPPRARAKPREALPNPLNDELALLRRVERALRNADPALALALIGELDERFPDSRLVEERQAARLMAGCRLNDAAAIARAHAFLHDNPASVYRQRVQLACERDTSSTSKQRDAASMKDVVSPDTSAR